MTDFRAATSDETGAVTAAFKIEDILRTDVVDETRLVLLADALRLEELTDAAATAR
jgi:hypothetical protein